MTTTVSAFSNPPRIGNGSWRNITDTQDSIGPEVAGGIGWQVTPHVELNVTLDYVAPIHLFQGSAANANALVGLTYQFG